jgi:hypothetical protein
MLRFLPLALALASCDFEQVIELDAADYTPRLVIGAFPAADSVFVLAVGRSRSAFEPGRFYGNEQIVRDATVRLLDEEGAVLDVFYFVEEGDYNRRNRYYARNGTRAQAGETYALEVSAPGFPDARATTRIPEPVAFTQEATFVPGGPSQRDHIAFEVRLPDPAGPNTYQLGLTQPVIGYDGVEEGYPIYFTSVDPMLRDDFASLGRAVDFDFDPDSERIFYAAYFRDDAFDGGERTLTVETPAHFYRDPDDPVMEFVLVLSTLDADYVRYQQSLALQRENEDNPFAEPVRVHTNVEGGLGVFAGLAVTRVPVRVEEE